MQSMIKRDLKNFRHMSSEIDELNATELVELNSLVQAVFTIPLTSAENERGFSKVNKI